MQPLRKRNFAGSNAIILGLVLLERHQPEIGDHVIEFRADDFGHRVIDGEDVPGVRPALMVVDDKDLVTVWSG